MTSELKDLAIPASDAFVEVKLFDIGAPPNVPIEVPAALFLSPVLSGHERLSAPMFASLIEHGTTKQRVMFDLGPRKDAENSPPSISDTVKNGAVKVTVEKDVTEQLVEGGVSLETISAVIWSHAHFDHIGDMSKFPSTTELVIGQGTVRDTYPANPKASLLESDFADRKVTELNFDKSGLSIGGFAALDYFNDGSLYLLSVPGHLSGHITALARVASDSFLLLGGDSCHHAGQLRPTEALHKHYPCPGQIIAAARHSISTKYFSSSGPEDGFNLAIHKEPLLQLPEGPSVYEDVVTAAESLRKLRAFDANPDVFVIIAHDASLVPIVELYPATLNEWKAKGYKERGLWAFVDESNPAFRFNTKPQ